MVSWPAARSAGALVRMRIVLMVRCNKGGGWLARNLQVPPPHKKSEFSVLFP